MKEEIKTFYPKDITDWRLWLEENHQKEKSVWLVYYKKSSKIPTVEYSEAVDEALCFGWIDSKVIAVDSEKYKQLYSVRKPKSVWSKVNKLKIEKLIGQGRIKEWGYKSINVAKNNGYWSILDDAEALIIPDDLEEAFKTDTKAKIFFEKLSNSTKRNILQWITLAKKQVTRLNRIKNVVELAKIGKKPKQF